MNHSANFDLEGFSRLVEALEPWLSEIVIIGGRAHRLFRFHPEAQPLAYDPLVTLDTQVAVPSTLTVQEEDLRSRLRAAGFEEEFLGEDQPPATHYRLGKDHGSFYAEFLTPLIGSEYDRDENRRATSEVAGVVSQQLRYIDLLLLAPWTTELSEANGFPPQNGKRVRVANPAHFLAQKLLIHKRRERGSRVKDVLYLHDTIELFGASLEILNREWNAHGRPALSENAIATVERAADVVFTQVTDDIRGAAQAAAGRALSPEAIRELCRAGLKAVFRKSAAQKQE